MDCIIPVILTLNIISISWSNLQVVGDLLGAKLEDSMKLEDMDSNEPDVVTRIMEVNKHLMNTTAWKDMLGGDMKVPSQRSTLKCPYFPSSCLWPHSIDGNVYIPYSLEQSFSESQKKTIIAALSEFNSLTCIKFKRRKYEYSYIRITAQQGCWAAIGRIGGPQPLSLEIPSCLWQGVIQHELMHSIGFIHEHCRNDRDQYVTVHLENVVSGMEFNFEKMDSNNLGMKYDYGSLMHYGRYLFSKNSLPTILPKPNPDTIIGQIYGFSVNDINKIRKLYNCKKCSELLVHDFGSFTTPNYPEPYPSHADCQWVIQAPAKYKVLLEFDSFHIRKMWHCTSDSVTIYDGTSSKLKPLKGPVCGRLAPAVVSSNSILLVAFSSFKNKDAKGFSAKYQFVKCAMELPNYKGHRLYSYEYFGSIDSNKSTQCVWLLAAPKGKKALTTVKIMNLKPSENCVDGYLNIFDVSKAPPDDKGKFCGNMNVPNLEGHTILFKFKHPGHPEKPGFKITYKFIVDKGKGCIQWSQHKILMMLLSLWLISSQAI